jgi:hypothetical protein
MKYAEKGIARNYADNYSGMIPILLPIDSTLLEKSQKDNFDFAGMMGGGNTQMTEMEIVRVFLNLAVMIHLEIKTLN